MVDKFLQNKQILQNTLASIIRELRQSQNKSISVISAETGMTKSMWADMEKGIKDPQFSTLVRIAEGLDISLDELIKNLNQKLPDDFSLIE